jgi:hypothetical protein
LHATRIPDIRPGFKRFVKIRLFCDLALHRRAEARAGGHSGLPDAKIRLFRDMAFLRAAFRVAGCRSAFFRDMAFHRRAAAWVCGIPGCGKRDDLLCGLKPFGLIRLI